LYILLKLFGFLTFKFDWKSHSFSKSTYEKFQIILTMAVYIFIFPRLQAIYYTNLIDELKNNNAIFRYFFYAYQMTTFLICALYTKQLVGESKLRNFFSDLVVFLIEFNVREPHKKLNANKILTLALLRLLMSLITYLTFITHVLPFMKEKNALQMFIVLLILSPYLTISLPINTYLVVALVIQYQFECITCELIEMKLNVKSVLTNVGLTKYQRLKLIGQSSETIDQLMRFNSRLMRLKERYDRLTGGFLAGTLNGIFLSIIMTVSVLILYDTTILSDAHRCKKRHRFSHALFMSLTVEKKKLFSFKMTNYFKVMYYYNLKNQLASFAKK
jgi:hypothetical protein